MKMRHNILKPKKNYESSAKSDKFHIMKVEKDHTRNLATYHEALQQKEANAPRRRRRQETIKLSGEINKIETKKTIQKN